MNKKSIIESLIFINQEPISIKKLAQIAEFNENEVGAIVDELVNDLKNGDRGVRIMKKEDEVQMVTSAENGEYVQKLVKSSLTEDLSPAALETLAAIAYFGPLTRHELENLRGVNSIFILRNLLIRGLIERQENPKHKLSYLYKISFDFMKRLGVENLADLPNYSEFANFKETFFKAKEERPAEQAENNNDVIINAGAIAEEINKDENNTNE